MLEKVPARFVLWLIAFLGYAVQYMLITNLNIAITDMVQRPRSLNTSSHFNISTDYHDADFLEKKFSWNEEQQGIILSGVYWILWLSHPAGGILSHHFGAKIVIEFSILAGCVLSILTPTIACLNFEVLVLVRIVQGFVVGLSFPSVVTSMQHWIPDKERTKFLTCILGISFGAAVTYFVGGFLIYHFGWESIFRVTGGVGLLWCAAWWYFMYDKPDDHPRILEKEKLYIFKNTNTKQNSNNSARRQRIPWSRILTTLKVYANALHQFGILWTYFIAIIYGPIYVKTSYNLDSIKTGIITGLSHFFRIFISILYAAYSDRIITKKVMSRTNARRLATVICSIIPGIALVGLAYNGQNFHTAIVLLYCIVGLTGVSISGPVAAMVEISPKYGGILQGLAGIISHTCGVLIPLLVGYLILHYDIGWRIVFLITSAICISTALIYLCVWNSDVCDWNDEDCWHFDETAVKLNDEKPQKC